MEKILKELYYDPSSGMLSLKKLYHKTKELGYKITQKQIKYFSRVTFSLLPY